MSYQAIKQEQLELLTEQRTSQRAKRVNIVSLKLVRESRILYKERQIKSPEDANKLFKQFLAETCEEHF